MKTALLVIDLIEDYFDAQLWPASLIPELRSEIVRSTNQLVAICREAGVSVIWIRQEFSSDMSDAFPHARKMQMRYALAGTPGASLLEGLQVAPVDEVLVKRRFSAFHETDLEAVLEAKGVSRVILAGITTAWCVRSSAVDAYQRDFEVILASDCMAAFDAHSHDESLAAMNGYIAAALSNSEIQRQLRENR